VTKLVRERKIHATRTQSSYRDVMLTHSSPTLHPAPGHSRPCGSTGHGSGGLLTLLPWLAGKYLSVCHFLNERRVVDPSSFRSSTLVEFRLGFFLVIFFDSNLSKVAADASTRRALVDCRLPTCDAGLLFRAVKPRETRQLHAALGAPTSRGQQTAPILAHAASALSIIDSRVLRATVACFECVVRFPVSVGRFVRISSAFAGRSYANASVRVSFRNQRVRPCDATNLDRRCRGGALATLCVRRELACKCGCTCRPRKVRRFY
jgi:hypothetical protein